MGDSLSKAFTVRVHWLKFRKNTGFQLVGNLTAITPEPTSQELSMLKKIDPLNTRSIEFEKM